MFDYLGRLATAPEETGVAAQAPNSRDRTWDAIGPDGFGPDVKFLNRALELGFERLGNAGKCWEMRAIDATRVVIGGFSDGASYATEILCVHARC
jgi:phospholipase/carboxylesterase